MKKLSVLFLLLAFGILVRAQTVQDIPTLQSYIKGNIFQAAERTTFLNLNVSAVNRVTDFQLLVPSQSGNAGLFLTTNGTTSSWAAASTAIPNEQIAFGTGTGITSSSLLQFQSGHNFLVDGVIQADINTGQFKAGDNNLSGNGMKIAINDLFFRNNAIAIGDYSNVSNGTTLLIANDSESYNFNKLAGTDSGFVRVHSNGRLFRTATGGGGGGASPLFPTTGTGTATGTVTGNLNGNDLLTDNVGIWQVNSNGGGFLNAGNFSIDNNIFEFDVTGSVIAFNSTALHNNTSLFEVDTTKMDIVFNAGTPQWSFRAGKILYRNGSIYSAKDTLSNTTWGTNAGAALNNSSANNTFIGSIAGQSNTSGVSNTYVGRNAGNLNTTGNQNTFVGTSAGQNDVGVGGGSYFGYNAGNSFTGGKFNIAMGQNAGRNVTSAASSADKNGSIFIGGAAGDGIGIADWNIFVGLETGYLGGTSSSNIIIGNAIESTSFSGGSITQPFGGLTLTDCIGLGNLMVFDTSNQFAVGSTTHHIDRAKTVANAGTFNTFYRTASPQGSQAATRGSIAIVNDGTHSQIWLKDTSNTSKNGWIQLGTGTGSGSVTSIATSSPITGGTITTSGTIGISDAAADGSTKGAAAFTAADFNASSGLISIDYTNGQAASASLKGFLTTSDWTTFNNKVSTGRAINTTSPLSGGGDLSADRTISIADAVADGSTKGAATFTAADFNSSSANISIDYTNGQSASASNKGFLTSTDWSTFNSKGSGTVTSIATTSPITGGTITGTGTIAINNAAADGSTKGAASFTAADFDASSGNISIDYANAQAASFSQKGFLTSADWLTFNGKGNGTVTSVATGYGLLGGTITNTGTLKVDSSKVLTRFHGDSLYALKSGTLAQFAATTSAQLAGVISDETGSGVLVFATSPTLTTPILGVASSTSQTITGTSGAGYLELQPQSSTPSSPAANTIRLFADATGRLGWTANNGFVRTLDGTGLTASRVFTLPDAAGTFALTTAIGTGGSDLAWSAAGGLSVPDAGASARGVITTGNQTLAGTKTFSGAVQVSAAGAASLTVGASTAAYRTTNGGTTVNAQDLFDLGNSAATAGSLAVLFDNATVGGMGFTHANGTRRILGSSIFITNLTNTAGSEANDLVFTTQLAGAAAAERLRITSGGGFTINTTTTTVGTTGNQTINKPSGTVNIAAAGTTVTVTDNLVSATSLVFAVIRTNDATARIANVVPAAGSFVINIVACTAEVSIGFFVLN